LVVQSGITDGLSLRVVTKQNQGVDREKSRKRRADRHERKNGSGAEAPNPLNFERLRRPLPYRDRVCDLTAAQAPISCMTGSTDSPLRSSVADQLLFQSAASLNEKASVVVQVRHRLWLAGRDKSSWVAGQELVRS
jgi:hypothetical protein